MSHPRECKYRMISRWPCQAAQQNAVVPSAVLASRSAIIFVRSPTSLPEPDPSTRYRATSNLPFRQAQCRAVRPPNDLFPFWPSLTSQLHSSTRYRTMCKCPDPADQWRRVAPFRSRVVRGSNARGEEEGTRMDRRAGRSPRRASSNGSASRLLWGTPSSREGRPTPGRSPALGDSPSNRLAALRGSYRTRALCPPELSSASRPSSLASPKSTPCSLIPCHHSPFDPRHHLTHRGQGSRPAERRIPARGRVRRQTLEVTGSDRREWTTPERESAGSAVRSSLPSFSMPDASSEAGDDDRSADVMRASSMSLARRSATSAAEDTVRLKPMSEMSSRRGGPRSIPRDVVSPSEHSAASSSFFSSSVVPREFSG
mmetsp:Transcript_49490/g.149137  ORF Transcript_49490/g.149137 Transcript_49490/m.149137 type:complete len:371 (-) Transcript_49490:460-1572(-)